MRVFCLQRMINDKPEKGDTKRVQWGQIGAILCAIVVMLVIWCQQSEFAVLRHQVVTLSRQVDALSEPVTGEFKPVKTDQSVAIRVRRSPSPRANRKKNRGCRDQCAGNKNKKDLLAPVSGKCKYYRLCTIAHRRIRG